jgi:hypothetical protein
MKSFFISPEFYLEALAAAFRKLLAGPARFAIRILLLQHNYANFGLLL